VWILAVLAYELLHLAAEFSLRVAEGGGCKAVVVLPVRRPRDLRRFAGSVDYVVVDDLEDAKVAEAAGLRWVLNRYSGKAGAPGTAPGAGPGGTPHRPPHRHQPRTAAPPAQPLLV